MLKFAKLFVKSEKKVRNETLKKLCSRVFFQAARIAFLLDETFIFKIFTFLFKTEIT